MRCKRLRLVVKKAHGYQDELKRQEFQERLKTKTTAQMVYVDEAGIDNRKSIPMATARLDNASMPQVGQTQAASVGLLLSSKNIFAPMTDDRLLQPRFV